METVVRERRMEVERELLLSKLKIRKERKNPLSLLVTFLASIPSFLGGRV